ncbi:2-keto-3-deoxygluconate permease [Bacillus sp. 1NLA3E]|jgi:2-keto-3-deoxygluconate permease|uniref:2-keto-3-deoxygluconate permease n=1 Tax=Bacillus sp. 1NLA3E TaxID=666686 RepID=UPI000247E9A1|nr:2-keto-3-deoxygluconate permease [Bacillus sp. 1NLA3E]AGK55823.1 2-keto-3-deoxygluconate permease [Bacillus sp. 1NLA3E]
MKIKATIEKIPGGMMIVPLFIGALLHTFAPNTAEFFGGFTGAMLTGTGTILAVFFFCIGTTIDVRSSGYIAKKGLTLLIGKVLFAALIGYIASQFIPAGGIQTGFFAGISVLVLIAAMNETNGGLYLAVMNHLGRKEDAAGFCFISIESGPFMTMVTLGVAGLGTFPWQAIVSTLIPFALGILLGSLDKDIRKFFGPAVPIFIPFFALSLGYALNLGMLVKSGVLGILLGVTVAVVSGGFLYILDRFVTGSDGVAGVAAGSTAGAAVAVPFAIAEIDPSFAGVAESATALIATCVIVTAVLTPFLTTWVAKWSKEKGIPAKKVRKQPIVDEINVKVS